MHPMTEKARTMITPHRLSCLCAATLVATLSGCATIATPSVEMHTAAPQAKLSAPVAAPAQGAIFQVATHRPLFEDRRARLAGDTLTIKIEETVTASQQSTSKINRNGSISAGMSALPFASVNFLGRLNAGGESSVVGGADGKTDTSNNFAGTITVVVQQVLPNGNLLVSGEKQVGVNQNVDVLRFSGTIDPRVMQPGSIVNSTQVANVRVESRGRGAQNEAQVMGWMNRFFNTITPF